MKKIVQLTFAAILGSLITLGTYKALELDQTPKANNIEVNSKTTDASAQLTNYNMHTFNGVAPTVDFTTAAAKTMPAVVHIKSSRVSQYTQGWDPLQDFFNDDFFGQFFGNPYGRGGNRAPQQRKSEASGSGVIISNDGYIVTNNHVIENSTDIEVVLYDKRSYKADLVGTDPSTDLALLKIQDSNLPYLTLANSDNARIGEWVLAVGNPFNLESTVTAGIVSAKGRNLDILDDRAAIESFIQTDAAVNPGNSGGALVNVEGELLGINTAIATPTGTYAGYAFAVPAAIVSKVVGDLMDFGVVQRGFIGISINNVDGKLAEEMDLPVTQGVYVAEIMEDGPADKAGMREGDIIISIEDVDIKNIADLQEQSARRSPGDRINVIVNRNGSNITLPLILENRDGTTERVSKVRSEVEMISLLGADFSDLTNDQLSEYGIDGGVQVTKLGNGKLQADTEIREGFIITKVNGTKVRSAKQLLEFIEANQGQGILFEGVYPGSRNKHYYGFGM